MGDEYQYDLEACPSDLYVLTVNLLASAIEQVGLNCWNLNFSLQGRCPPPLPTCCLSAAGISSQSKACSSSVREGSLT